MHMGRMKLTVIVEPQEEGGYTVYAPSLPGCISEGDTKEEALENIKSLIKRLGMTLKGVRKAYAFGYNKDLELIIKNHEKFNHTKESYYNE